MYSSFLNQFTNLSHYIIAFILIFVIYPKFVFQNKNESVFEYLISNFIRMVFIVIVIGYVLAAFKIFEVFGILIALAIVLFLSRYLRNSDDNIEKIKYSAATFVYDLFDGKSKRKLIFKEYFKKTKEKLPKSKSNIFSIFMLISVIGYSAYLRFYDAIMHAAPAMSDAYVTLAWMKYIDRRILFYDGIYPQGFHIFLATIHKFAFSNPLYILKYTGPLNGILITLGIYFVVSRLTKKMVPGIIAALIYGVLGSYISGDWIRQAATNSQEFGFVFVLPTIYFIYKYVKENKKNYLITSLCGAAVCGLVHTVSLVFVVIGAAIVILSALIVNFKKSIKPSLFLILGGTASGVVSMIPIGIGLLFGLKFNTSANSFIMDFDSTLQISKLYIIDYVALASMVLMFFYIFISREKWKEKLFPVFIFLFSAASFFIYYAGGYLTKSTVIGSRGAALWYILISVVIGYGFYILFRVLYKIKIYDAIMYVLCLATIVTSIYLLKPQPIIPYKMEYDSNIEQYLRITKAFRNSEWMIVSQDEGYSVVLGTGYHMLVQDFLKNYNPQSIYLRDLKTKEILRTQDVFIYCEKNVFTTDFDTMKKIYARRKLEKPLLKEWVKKYSQKHNNLSKYYEDENIIIYRIHQEIKINVK